MSIARILSLLVPSTQTQQQEKTRHDPLRLATAAILLDIAYADGSVTTAEGGSVTEFLSKKFELDEDETKELVEAADEIRKHTVDHFALTHYIRKNSPLAERIEIVKTMWRLAFTDGTLSHDENYLVRKIADLLGLEHHVMIDAKSDVMRELGR